MNGTYRTSSALEKSGPRLIDEFLRRELRVGDPRNPRELVTALRRRYAGDAARIDQESAGLPVLYYQPQPLALPPGPAAGDTPGTREERRVQADLESDLTALIDSRDNREWAPEIRGWRDTLLREFSDGAAAARFGQDPAMRERAFLAVRRLGEFSRVARLVGVMNLALNCDYRRLAASLDDACDVIRILMGEALYNAGLSDGGLIIQVPLVDLRQRRDSLVLGVRGLAGLDEEGFDGDWGDDIAAYRRLLEELDRRNVPELKVYLREELLAPILDNMVSTVSRQDPEALRQLAATIPVEIGRLNRLREIASTLRLGTTIEAGVAASISKFEQALQLFIDGFARARSGARLIDLALPLPMAAQQADEEDADARRILREIVGLRGELARETECFLSCCGCDVDELRCQVKLDKVLFDVDRAIDLFAQGQGRPPEWGTEEKRASICGIVARNMKNERGCITPEVAYSLVADVAKAGLVLVSSARTLAEGFVTDESDEQQALTDVGQFARDIEPFIRLLIAAGDLLAAGRPISESIHRELENPQFPVPAGEVAADDDIAIQLVRLTRLVATIRSGSSAPSSALQLILDTAELVAGDSAMEAIAGVRPTPDEIVTPPTPEAYRGDGVGATLADIIRDELDSTTQGQLQEALDAIFAAQAALRTSLQAIGLANAANTSNAGLESAKAAQAAKLAHAAAFPTGGTPPTDLGQRALLDAEDGASAAANVAEVCAGLTENREGETSVLFDVLRRLEDTLTNTQSPLPRDAAELGILMREVFEDQLRGEQDWLDLIASLAPRCLNGGRRDLVLAARELLYGNPNFTKTGRLPAIPVNAPAVPLRSGVTGVADAVRAAAITVKTALEDRFDSGRFGGSAAILSPSAPAVVTRPATGPVITTAPSTAPARDFPEFVRTLHEATKQGQRGEVRAAIKAKIIRPDDWKYFKKRYKKFLTDEFVDLVDNLLDASRKGPIDPTVVHDVLQRPFDLGE